MSRDIPRPEGWEVFEIAGGYTFSEVDDGSTWSIGLHQDVLVFEVPESAEGSGVHVFSVGDTRPILVDGGLKIDRLSLIPEKDETNESVELDEGGDPQIDDTSELEVFAELIPTTKIPAPFLKWVFGKIEDHIAGKPLGFPAGSDRVVILGTKRAGRARFLGTVGAILVVLCEIGSKIIDMIQISPWFFFGVLIAIFFGIYGTFQFRGSINSWTMPLLKTSARSMLKWTAVLLLLFPVLLVVLRLSFTFASGGLDLLDQLFLFGQTTIFAIGGVAVSGFCLSQLPKTKSPSIPIRLQASEPVVLDHGGDDEDVATNEDVVVKEVASQNR